MKDFSEKLERIEDTYGSFGKMKKVKKEAAKVIIGQEEAINYVLMGFFAGGHSLLESVPGLAKTLLGETLTRIMNISFKRIQLTPDLTPAEILGYIMPIFGTTEFRTIKGPIFAGYVLADEFNRAPEKTQSAFMQAMQEKEVTIGTETYKLEDIFTLMGTRNPIETRGTEAVAEAVLDRFLANVAMPFPSLEETKKIMTSTEDLSRISLEKVCGPEDIMPVRQFLQTSEFIPYGHPIKDYVGRLIHVSHPELCGKFLNDKDAHYYRNHVQLSLASPRSAKAFLRAAVVYSFGILGEKMILPEHIQTLAYGILRHRIILEQEAEQDKITPDNMISWLLDRVPIYG